MSILGFTEEVRVSDTIIACMEKHKKQVVQQRDIELQNKGTLPPSIAIEGFVDITAFDSSGVIVARRRGNNIWTLTGREYLALLMSYQSEDGGGTPYRNDRIRYMGFGEGVFPEESKVARLHTPMEFRAQEFLAPIVIPPQFPLYPARTIVRYELVIGEDDITFEGGEHESEGFISEAGLFTDGSDYDRGSTPELLMWAPGSRDTGINDADKQRPMAYKAFDPIPKKRTYAIYIMWEIRF